MRMQHYTIFQHGLSYVIEYRRSEHHSMEDCLSRLSLPCENASKTVNALDVLFMDTVESLLVLANELQKGCEAH